MMMRDLFAVTNLVVVVPMKEMHPGRIQDFTLGRDSAETSKASRPRIEAPSGLDFLKIFLRAINAFLCTFDRGNFLTNYSVSLSKKNSFTLPSGGGVWGGGCAPP